MSLKQEVYDLHEGHKYSEGELSAPTGFAAKIIGAAYSAEKTCLPNGLVRQGPSLPRVGNSGNSWVTRATLE